VIGGEHGPDVGLRVFVATGARTPPDMRGVYDRLVERLGAGGVFVGIDVCPKGRTGQYGASRWRIASYWLW
jgi:hypothetical protein